MKSYEDLYCWRVIVKRMQAFDPAMIQQILCCQIF
uniref:Uncharacterized protein n=1 Tax=Escherichia coli TaxID=562 RepID=A0A8E6P3N7_ECOLX|nr:hypothetical protein FDGFPMFE_00021 [Escherichia coli]QVQ62201.1 hypothetical protein FDGFPMFE_00159 [Escherichia coli]QVQ62228.1 hypothetical protein FDGFPMFE_00186 [Escherichia coli]QVQ62255.1 hypothetical protein FDGFPMFE_00213 [Escherichia coli]